jgi:hypothetical protein
MAIKKPHVSYLPQMKREIPTDALSLKSGFVGFVEFIEFVVFVGLLGLWGL